MIAHPPHCSTSSASQFLITISIFSYTFLTSLHFSACNDTDTMTLNGFIRDSDKKTLVSARGRFELGFFTPDGSSDDRRYVGIWYHKCKQLYVVWVANRDRSLFNTSGSFRLTKDGELKLLDENNNTEYWSAGVGGRRSNPSKIKRKVTLTDSGNLVFVRCYMH